MNSEDELTNDKTEEPEGDGDVQLIDPNDLIIINNPENFKPTEEMILAYANLLGYNPATDPKEILNIAEKYLTIKIPDNISRAFTRADYRILYIDMETQEITLDSQLETRAKEEFEACREKYKHKTSNNFKSTDEELKKKLEEQKKYNDSLRNSASNIQIIDEPEEEEDKKEEYKTPALNNSINDNNKDENENSEKNDKNDKKEKKLNDDIYNINNKNSNKKEKD